MDIIMDDIPEVEVNIPLDNKDLVILQMVARGAPSITEMSKVILAKSPATVFNRLIAMEGAGLVSNKGYRSIRSRRITRKGLEVLLVSKIIDRPTFDVKVKEIEDGEVLRFPD